MALSLDDKLLGEKVDNYCSSSEGEEDDEGQEYDPEGKEKAPPSGPKVIPDSEIKAKDYPGFSTNTGPKGVINDWREFKRLESEKRENQEKERQALLKKLSVTCRSHLDDEKEKQQDQKFLEEIDKELEEFEDDFLKEYRKRRLEEMRKAMQNVPKFGKLIDLDSGSFVEAIDKEKPQVSIIIHLFEEKNSACDTMNGCLKCLAQEYPTVKFCKLKASATKLSIKFAKLGVPALLVYKAGELTGNFVRISDELGDDFLVTDVESFLLEYGHLPSDQLINSAIRDGNTGEYRGQLADEDDSGSDFDVD